MPPILPLRIQAVWGKAEAPLSIAAGRYSELRYIASDLTLRLLLIIAPNLGRVGNMTVWPAHPYEPVL